jgi:hypothetical protein
MKILHPSFRVCIFALFVIGCSSIKHPKDKGQPLIGEKLDILVEFLAQTTATDVAINDDSEAILYKELSGRYKSLISFNQVLKSNGNWITKSNPQKRVLVCSFGACSNRRSASIVKPDDKVSDAMICMFFTEAAEGGGKVYRANFKLVDNTYKLLNLELAAIL